MPEHVALWSRGERGWSHEVTAPDGTGPHRLWHEPRIAALLAGHRDGLLFVSGCVANQGLFYDRFAAVLLLSAPVEIILQRLVTRATNGFGTSDHERRRILADLVEVESLLRAGATAEIDTDRRVAEVVAAVESAAVLSVACPNVCDAPPT